jgi:uncharacterized membrane protein
MEQHHTSKRIKEFKHFKPIRNINHDHNENLSVLDRTAIWITNHVGSMGFFLIIITWTIIWLSWNMYAPRKDQFDPYPGFVLWLFVSNLIQILLMPLIMIGQNLQSKHSELRAEVDFEVNLKAEMEIQDILIQLEGQNEKIEKILSLLQQKELK